MQKLKRETLKIKNQLNLKIWLQLFMIYVNHFSFCLQIFYFWRFKSTDKKIQESHTRTLSSNSFSISNSLSFSIFAASSNIAISFFSSSFLFLAQFLFWSKMLANIFVVLHSLSYKKYMEKNWATKRAKSKLSLCKWSYKDVKT